MPAPMVAPAMMPTGNTSSDEEGKEEVRMEPPYGSELCWLKARLATRPQVPLASLDCVWGWFKSWDLKGRSALCLGLSLSFSLIKMGVTSHPGSWGINLILALVVCLSLSFSPPSCEAWSLLPGLDSYLRPALSKVFNLPRVF